MNKTMNINLAGLFFHVDEAAYLKLEQYLNSIKKSFEDTQDCAEIIEDVETRIAEIFNERMKNIRQVISTKDVDDVIVIMGQPEDYWVDNHHTSETKTHQSQERTTPIKKLFRDPDGRYIAGVASGLSYYLQIDAVWVRVIFVLTTLSGGIGVILYVLLWIFMPKARSTTDKLMMKGEAVTIENIKKKVNDEFNDIAKVVSETTKSASDSIEKTVQKVSSKTK